MENRNILSLTRMREMLADRNISSVSRNTGINRVTLSQIMNGTTDPKYSTMERLSNYLEEKHGQPE